MPKGRDGSIRRNQQGKHIKTIACVIANKPGARADDFHDVIAHVRLCPQQAADQRLTGRIERGAVTEKPMVRSGRDHVTASILNMDDAIPLDAERTDARVFQPFAGHRLYGISQNLCNLHSQNFFLAQERGRVGIHKLLTNLSSIIFRRLAVKWLPSGVCDGCFTGTV